MKRLLILTFIILAACSIGRYTKTGSLVFTPAKKDMPQAEFTVFTLALIDSVQRYRDGRYEYEYNYVFTDERNRVSYLVVTKLLENYGIGYRIAGLIRK